MGEGILRRLGEGRVQVASAGTLGLVGHPPHPFAVEACARVGVDISAQRSRGLDRALLAWADHVACMDFTHLRFVREHLAEPGRAFLLDDAEIPDPLGGPLTDFEETRDVIRAACARLLARLAEAAS